MKLVPMVPTRRAYEWELAKCDACGKVSRRNVVNYGPLAVGETPWCVDVDAKPYTRTYCPNCVPETSR